MSAQRRAPPLALRGLLVDEWDPTNVLGYGPSGSGDRGISIHPGSYDDSRDSPQIALRFVDGTPENGGYSGIAASGAGYWQKLGYSLDVQCIAGSKSDVASDEHPFDVAWKLSREVRDIVHEASTVGIQHPDTGELEYREPTPGGLFSWDDTGTPDPYHWGLVQEVGFRADDRPP